MALAPPPTRPATSPLPSPTGQESAGNGLVAPIALALCILATVLPLVRLDSHPPFVYQ